MHILAKKKIILVLFTFLFRCSANEATFFKPPNLDVMEKSLEEKIFSDPKQHKNSSKQGIVAFGIYRIEYDPDSLRRAVLGKTMQFGVIPKPSTITFSKIINADPETWKLEPISSESIPYTHDKNIDIVNTKIKKVKEIIAFLVPDLKQKYVLSSISWSERCGKYCTRNITCTIDPEFSFKSIPIQAKQGQINFIGIYKIDFRIATDGNSSCYDDHRDMHFKVMPILTGGEPTILKEVISNLSEEFYFGQQVEPIYAEIKFLRDLIEVQRDGYWKLRAEERLNVLGYKYENGFLIEIKK